jgi:hypothetical protein
VRILESNAAKRGAPAWRLGAGAPREEVSKVYVAKLAKFERTFATGCRNGSMGASPEIRKASRARAPDSPVPGEHTDV